MWEELFVSIGNVTLSECEGPFCYNRNIITKMPLAFFSALLQKKLRVTFADLRKTLSTQHRDCSKNQTIPIYRRNYRKKLEGTQGQSALIIPTMRRRIVKADPKLDLTCNGIFIIGVGRYIISSDLESRFQYP